MVSLKKRYILVVVLVLWVGLFGINMINPPTDQEENTTNTNDQVEELGEIVEQPLGEEEPEVEETPEEDPIVVTCYDVPESPEWGSDLDSMETVIGQGLVVDPYADLDVPVGVEVTWSQVKMNLTSTWYAPHYSLSIQAQENGSAMITPTEPGVYRLKCSTVSEDYLLDVEASAEIQHKWDMKGVIFGDVWGALGSPEFNIAPDDPECRETVLSHAMDGPVRIGANYIGVVPAQFYSKVLPVPMFKDEGNFLSLTNETYYAALVESAHDAGLKVIHTEQSAPHWDLTSEEQEALGTIWSDPDWVDAWFEEWTAYVVPRAEMAERYGVEMFVPYLFPDSDTFKAEDYVEHWTKLIEDIREVYSGDIALNVVNADERLFPLIDDLDGVLITVFPGLYTGSLADQYNPTVDEIAEITEGIFNAPREFMGGKLPVYYVFGAQSTDGQIASEDADWKISMTGVDFEEQVIYHEGFFKALEDETWVNGVISERWDYFDQYGRTGDSYEAKYFDMTREASPRCKPAEDLIGFWFNLR